MGVGATALTILLVPLAILAPVYPPAIQAALLPFAAADATGKASQDADRLRQEAAKARQDSAACGDWLAARHPELAEKFQRTLSDGSLRATIQDDLHHGLEGYANLRVVSLAQPEDSSSSTLFLSEASRRQLQSVLEVDIHSVDLSVESRGPNTGDCAFKISGNINVHWWDVGNTLIVYSVGALPNEGAQLVLYKSEPLSNEGTPPADEVDLLTLVDHPEQFRAQVAKWLRNGVLRGLNKSMLKFP
jgi:hypothetical protein